jgi:AraC family transcriptional regulator of adaptative response/methylated-DNA-[protein]-cysteine methyltransferase
MSANSLSQSALDYQRIEKAILYLEKNFQNQPSLEAVARHVHLSEFHFQRLFKRWAGISPKKFLQFLTVEYAKSLLSGAQNLLDVTYESGLSSSGRLHDLFVNTEAVTPGEYKNRGEGLIIQYGFHPTPFGDCIVAATDKGVCGLSFVEKSQRRAAVEKLRRNWQAARLVESESSTRQYVAAIFSRRRNASQSLPVFLKGTNFQIKVWEALLRIPEAKIVSYEEIARAVNMPRATRAVANAVAKNPIAYLIPCHRVIRKTGVFGKYQWGASRKKALLAWEASKA